MNNVAIIVLVGLICFTIMVCVSVVAQAYEETHKTDKKEDE